MAIFLLQCIRVVCGFGMSHTPSHQSALSWPCCSPSQSIQNTLFSLNKTYLFSKTQHKAVRNSFLSSQEPLEGILFQPSSHCAVTGSLLISPLHCKHLESGGEFAPLSSVHFALCHLLLYLLGFQLWITPPP